MTGARSLVPMVALVGLVGLALLSGDEQTAAPSPQPKTPGKPPTDIPWPQGWQRYRGVPTDTMVATAKASLTAKVPLGSLYGGGDLSETDEWAVFLEWHWHPPGAGFAAEGWHRGATLVWRRKV